MHGCHVVTVLLQKQTNKNKTTKKGMSPPPQRPNCHTSFQGSILRDSVVPNPYICVSTILLLTLQKRKA